MRSCGPHFSGTKSNSKTTSACSDARLTTVEHAPHQRLGVVRPSQVLSVIAAAEARVLSLELSRRLGSIRLDLRIAGDACGPFQPVAHAAWPTGIDATIDASAIWSSATPHLTPLFGRTIEPAAAEVRTRMLRHIGIVPTAPFTLDESMIASLLDTSIRPTDLWIVVQQADEVTLADDAIKSLAAAPGSPEQTDLDQAFDRIAADVANQLGEAVIARTIEELKADRRAIEADLAEIQEELERSKRESANQLFDLAAENIALRQRLARAEVAASVEQ
jgi:hypothetical protein